MSKSYLITGAARGIGRGLTRLLLAKGHRVFLVDNNETELTHLSTQLQKWFPSDRGRDNTHHPPAWHIFTADLTDLPLLESAATKASTFFNGHLDVLINNAAHTSAVGGAHILDPNFPDLWATTVSVNLTAPAMLTRACIPMLRRRPGRNVGGSVVMVSSTRAWQSEPNSEGYAATKAGLVGLTHALACSLAGDGVRVNAILPGWIHVAGECKEGDEGGGKWEDGISEDDMRWHWAGRVGKVEDVLRAVEYLGGGEEDRDGAVFITGTEMVVDGGVTRRMVYPE